MNSFKHDLVKLLVSKKKYDVITEYFKAEFPDKTETVVVSEYAGTDVRVFKTNKDTINILCPNEMTTVQENAVTKALENGTIFDDAETVENSAKYIELTTLPHNAMMNKGKAPLEKLHTSIGCVIGRMDDDGRCEVDDTDITNGCNFIKDVTDYKNKNTNVENIVNDYISNKDHGSLTKTLRHDIANIEREIESIEDISEEDAITDDDWEYLDMMSDTSTSSEDNEDVGKLPPEMIDKFYNKLKGELSKNEESYQEGFLTKRPKKLKPIPRDIIPYIQVEMNAIQDTNDQAMLSGYTCSKLELVDFYLNVLDTNDERYIVPHTRQYLVQFQNDLNRLLTQILRLRPINKNDRVWRVNVNYPEGWRG